ncbi:hypothetical protein [Massilia rubra]|uniref:HEAT repeat domain-containing protein n=1 Tax=Massilia rubra TaxID=2607910 RepID=A0ABX0LTN3_9BURK|nr:hypothetical protein [Massilia rubra]NHZ35656.1 hypothetical protein [Massilia rubra]
MTLTFLRTAMLMALLAHLPAAAISYSPVVVLPPCPAAIVDASLAQLEKLMSEDPNARPYCYPEALKKRGAQAVPMLLRLLQDERHPVRSGAAYGIAELREAGAAALPALIAHHRRLVADLARQEAAHGSDGVDQETLLLMRGLSRAIGGLQTVDASVAPYLESVFFDPGSTLDVRRASAIHVWDWDTPEPIRLRMTPVLLADETTFPDMRSQVASFLFFARIDTTGALPQLRASLLMPRGHEMVSPYLVVQGAAAGIPHVLRLYADAAKDSAMRRAIESQLRERESLPEMDWQLSAAAHNPAMLPTVLELMEKTGIHSRRTMEYLATRLDIPSEVDSTLRIFISLRRPAPQAHPRLVALLLASGKDDLARRDLLLQALSATDGQATIPQPFLLAGLQHDLALNRRTKLGSAGRGTCLPGAVLAQAAPLGPAYLPMLKRAYADTAGTDAPACVRAVGDIIANSGSRSAVEFLYEQLFSKRSEEERRMLMQPLKNNVGLLLPTIRREIDGLRDERRDVVESLLRVPQASEFLAQYRARVVPGLLTLPWTESVDQDRAGLDETQVASDTPACARLALVVKRVDTLGLTTPEVTTWLMRVYAGPCVRAHMRAREALEALRNQEYGKRPMRVRQVDALLANTPPGLTRKRLERLRRLFDWTGYERSMNEMAPPIMMED